MIFDDIGGWRGSGAERFGARAISPAGVCVVVARGELDRAASDRRAAVLDQALAQRDPVLVDVCELTLLGATAIRVLLGTRTRVQGAGRRFAIACRPQSPARRALTHARLCSAFDLFSDRHTARWPHCAAAEMTTVTAAHQPAEESLRAEADRGGG